MPRTRRFRRFAITLYTAPDFLVSLNTPVRYFIAGKEQCPDTKRIHYQCYMELTKPHSLAQLKVVLDDEKAHCECAKGSAKQNIVYCKKDGNIYREFGEPASQGKRNDIIGLRDHFKGKKRLREAIESDELVAAVARYPRFVNTLELHYAHQRDSPTRIIVYWGATGLGKSRRAFYEASLLGPVYFKPLGKWWDGYEANTAVILEDFRGEIPLATVLRLADRYPLRVPFKGGFREFTSSVIYITSNIAPESWWNRDQKGYEASYAAFLRRVESITEFTDEWIPAPPDSPDGPQREPVSPLAATPEPWESEQPDLCDLESLQGQPIGDWE